MPGRAGGRHPRAVQTVVRLTSDAVADIERLLRKGDPQVVRWALKKMIHLEQDPEAGNALLGGLVGWRKLTVGDRGWRLVWRVTHDTSGAVIVDVAEIWAFGARSDSEVYEEVAGRIAAAPETPATKALVDVMASLRQLGADLDPTPEPAEPEPVPTWLRDALLYVVRLPASDIDAMSSDEAHQTWTAHTTGQRR